MKNLFIALSILLFIAPKLYAGNGSFLILKSTHFYSNPKKSGQRILTRKRTAYEVISINSPKSKSLMFNILVPVKNNMVNGSGYIVETDAELQNLGVGWVKVYQELPNKKRDLTHFQLVPSNQLSFTGQKKTSPDFANLTWRAVNFKTNVPKKYWVSDWAGIYRPDKDAKWLGETYKAVLSKKLSGDLMTKILMGLVEPGFTKDQVRLALGSPLQEELIENNTKTEWIYNSLKVIFDNNLVLRVL